MKSKIILGCTAALALSLTACSNSAETGTTTTDANATSTAAADSSQSSAATLANDGSCEQTTETDVAALFDRWNESLQTGDPAKVVENYAEESVLLPTVSNQVRTTAAEKEDYFEHFLEKKPKGVINERWIEIDCDYAIDAGNYTFSFDDGSKVPARYTFVYGFENGEWKILTHHSSPMPEDGAATNLPAATGTTGSPDPELEKQQCKVATEEEITGLFTTWNDALQTGDPQQVADLYADKSILLPTVSNELRFTEAEKEDYFEHFLEKKPNGTIDESWITLGCNTATNAGLYTFEYSDGTKVPARFTYTYRWNGEEWEISSHHSSAMPEGAK